MVDARTNLLIRVWRHTRAYLDGSQGWAGRPEEAALTAPSWGIHPVFVSFQRNKRSGIDSWCSLVIGEISERHHWVHTNCAFLPLFWALIRYASLFSFPFLTLHELTNERRNKVVDKATLSLKVCCAPKVYLLATSLNRTLLCSEKSQQSSFFFFSGRAMVAFTERCFMSRCFSKLSH